MGRDDEDTTGSQPETIRTNTTTPDQNEHAASPSPPPPPLPPRRKPSSEVTQSKATTAVSSIEIQTLSFPDGTRGTFPAPGAAAALPPAHAHARSVSSPVGSGYSTPRSIIRAGSGDFGDALSIMSGFAPTVQPGTGDLASLLAGEPNRKKSRAWRLLRTQSAGVQPFESIAKSRGTDAEPDMLAPVQFADFAREFDEVPDTDDGGGKGSIGVSVSDEERMRLWKGKMKHYMILSSAGKPIYSRHGDLSLVNSYMGVVQMIISFYEGAKNPLLGFTAGSTRFVVTTEGPLYLIAISRLGESDAQLRDQLDALYMQILSTLTLPTLKNIFANRPSTDLRKPLQGTESLLSSLADSFTRGSPSSMLGALECLRLRKSQRATINAAFLRARSDKLLYGLIVAGGRLVSVIRPRKHSLHPSDLQLIFNMLFESGGVRAGGGESWIPLCLPAFNNRGYLYMYVSFFGDSIPGSPSKPPPPSSHDPQTQTPQKGAPGVGSGTRDDEETKDDIAIILISADKESFFALQDMREKIAQQLERNGSLATIRTAARAGRPRVANIAPGAQISHFLYKSRANVQFCMASLSTAYAATTTTRKSTDGDDEDGDTSTTAVNSEDGHDTASRGQEQGRQDQDHSGKIVARRRRMTLYHQLHAAAHARHAHLRILHSVSEDAAGLAWVTPVFEFYCVAGPNVSRAIMTQGANKIIQWAKREEERLFIIGGGVF